MGCQDSSPQTASLSKKERVDASLLPLSLNKGQDGEVGRHPLASGTLFFEVLVSALRFHIGVGVKLQKMEAFCCE